MPSRSLVNKWRFSKSIFSVYLIKNSSQQVYGLLYLSVLCSFWLIMVLLFYEGRWILNVGFLYWWLTSCLTLLMSMVNILIVVSWVDAKFLSGWWQFSKIVAIGEKLHILRCFMDYARFDGREKRDASRIQLKTLGHLLLPEKLDRM